MLAAGIALGAYEIIASLGAGGMGEVRHARGARPGPGSANPTRFSGVTTPTYHSASGPSRAPAATPRR